MMSAMLAMQAFTPPPFVNTPSARTILIDATRKVNPSAAVAGDALPLGAPVALDALDPTDVLDYAVDISSYLQADEQFTSIRYAVHPHSILLGFLVLEQAEFAPAVLPDGRYQFWCSVDPADRDAKAWAGRGTIAVVEFTTITTLGRTLQRSAGIQVRQQ